MPTATRLRPRRAPRGSVLSGRPPSVPCPCGPSPAGSVPAVGGVAAPRQGAAGAARWGRAGRRRAGWGRGRAGRAAASAAAAGGQVNPAGMWGSTGRGARSGAGRGGHREPRRAFPPSPRPAGVPQRAAPRAGAVVGGRTVPGATGGAMRCSLPAGLCLPISAVKLSREGHPGGRGVRLRRGQERGERGVLSGPPPPEPGSAPARHRGSCVGCRSGIPEFALPSSSLTAFKM